MELFALPVRLILWKVPFFALGCVNRIRYTFNGPEELESDLFAVPGNAKYHGQPAMNDSELVWKGRQTWTDEMGMLSQKSPWSVEQLSAAFFAHIGGVASPLCLDEDVIPSALDRIHLKVLNQLGGCLFYLFKGLC